MSTKKQAAKVVQIDATTKEEIQEDIDVWQKCLDVEIARDDHHDAVGEIRELLEVLRHTITLSPADRETYQHEINSRLERLAAKRYKLYDSEQAINATQELLNDLSALDQSNPVVASLTENVREALEGARHVNTPLDTEHWEQMAKNLEEKEINFAALAHDEKVALLPIIRDVIRDMKPAEAAGKCSTKLSKRINRAVNRLMEHCELEIKGQNAAMEKVAN
jgi:uncharacterized alpha-E superfamily protein